MNLLRQAVGVLFLLGAAGCRCPGQGQLTISGQAVSPAQSDYVYVLGYVRAPGTYRIASNTTMTVWQAFRKAGGLADEGRADNCYLIQYPTNSEPTAVHIDLSKVLWKSEKDTPMQPGDTLVVGSSTPVKLKLKRMYPLYSSVTDYP